MTDYSDAQVETLLRQVALSGGFNAWLGVTLIAAGQGRCEIKIEVAKTMRQHHGFAHGGVVGAVADIASSWAAASIAGDVVTSSYTLHLMGPASAPRLRARADVVKQGKHAATVEARVFAVDEADAEKLVAISLASISIVAPPAT